MATKTFANKLSIPVRVILKILSLLIIWGTGGIVFYYTHHPHFDKLFFWGGVLAFICLARLFAAFMECESKAAGGDSGAGTAIVLCVMFGAGIISGIGLAGWLGLLWLSIPIEVVIFALLGFFDPEPD